MLRADEIRLPIVLAKKGESKDYKLETFEKV